MNAGVRENFRRVATFQKVEQIPHFEAMGFWGETIARWHNEGLPKDKTPSEYFGIDQFMDNSPEEIRYHSDNVTRPCYWPPFETKVIEETNEYVIRQEEDGIIKKQKKDLSSMPQFLKFPVNERKDWEELKWRLDSSNEERYKGVKEAASSLRERKNILRFGICGCYGFSRNLFGEERLAYIYYDDPKLLHEIMEHWLKFCTGIADHLCPLVDFDYVFIWEDMAFKTGPLISPKLFREFVLPYHREFIGYMKKTHHIDLFMVDSDGNNFDILPLFTEAGVNIFIPLEIAAGMEPLLIREKYPKLVLFGGIDKRTVIKGKKATEEEILRKVPRMLENGGYFPSIDHHVPPDVSFDNFCYYIEFLRKIEKEM